jgi:phytoene dehydrogenase-like protein
MSTPNSNKFDHLIVGGGHNGLVCAATLARRGRRVLVVEAAADVGGAAITREFAPGFRVSAGAHLLHALPDALVRSLELERHGLRFAARGLPTASLGETGSPVVFAGGGATGVAGVIGTSTADAQAYSAFAAQMGRFARIMSHLDATVPFRLSLATWQERRDALTLALKIRLLGKRDMREFLRVVGMNAYDLLEDTFASPLIKGALGFDASLGAEYAARSPGTVLTLLQRWAGQSRTGALGLAQPAGGMGAVTQAMAAAARAAGAQIRSGARVKRITVEGDRVAGVQLDSGETISAGTVISNADPRTTFLKLVGPEYLDTDFVRRIDHHRARGLVAKVHLALDGLPTFRGVDARTTAGRLLVAPSLDYLELAFNPSKYREVPDSPALEITLPSINDSTLAPAGKHVMSINVMFVPYDLGADPAGARTRLLGNVIDTLERHCPGIRNHIAASELLTPADIEREFGMTGGHWHHGALGFDQFHFTRPVPGAAQYATPLAGLYLCGAGSHPGGGVMGMAGMNAAGVVLQGSN